jgi:acylphosphatase
MPDEDVRATIRVSGLVQGVFYRATTQQTARSLALRGWVRNELDGSVSAVAEGPRSRVEELVSFCRKGPPGARVDDLEVDMSPATGEFEDFRITR